MGIPTMQAQTIVGVLGEEGFARSLTAMDLEYVACGKLNCGGFLIVVVHYFLQPKLDKEFASLSSLARECG